MCRMKVRTVVYQFLAFAVITSYTWGWPDGWALFDVTPVSHYQYVPVSHHKFHPGPAYDKCYGNKEGEQRCMQDLGCFTLTSDFFDSTHRPCNILPEDRVSIGTRFILYTPSDKTEGRIITSEGIGAANIDSSLPIKIIVHSTGEHHIHSPWIRRMKDEFLQNGDYNVIIVDWHDGSKQSYMQTVANSRVVGAEIARLVTSLQDNANVDVQNIHIIGHSLGAHVAGYAGERIKVGRITGLDPAEAHFGNMPATVRLDPTDADLVDVIHTDADGYGGGLGMKQTVGHADFYPNGGQHQPGCEGGHYSHIHAIKGHKGGSFCNHLRAVELFINSIKQDEVCAPVGHACADWETFLEGKCADCGDEGRDCAIMGIRAEEYRSLRSDDSPKMFFLKTKDYPPFCLQQYQLTLEISRPKDGISQPGKMHILIQGDNKEARLHSVHSFHQVKEGDVYTAVVVSTNPLGTVQNVSVWWESHAHGHHLYHSRVWHKGSYHPVTPDVTLEKLTITPMSIVTTSEEERTGSQMQFCRSGESSSAPNGGLFWYQFQTTC